MCVRRQRNSGHSVFTISQWDMVMEQTEFGWRYTETVQIHFIDEYNDVASRKNHPFIWHPDGPVGVAFNAFRLELLRHGQLCQKRNHADGMGTSDKYAYAGPHSGCRSLYEHLLYESNTSNSRYMAGNMGWVCTSGYSLYKKMEPYRVRREAYFSDPSEPDKRRFDVVHFDCRHMEYDDNQWNGTRYGYHYGLPLLEIAACEVYYKWAQLTH